MTTAKIKRLSLALAGIALLGLVSAGTAAAAPGPAWEIVAGSNTAAQPGGQITYYVTVLNAGDPTDPTHSEANSTDGSEVKIAVDLPPQMKAVSAEVIGPTPFDCSSIVPGSDDPFACVTTEVIGQEIGPTIAVVADVSPLAAGNPTVSYEVSGGGALSVSTFDSTRIAPSPPGFGIDSFDSQILADATGDLSTEAGAHPFSADTQILFNTSTDAKEGNVWPLESPKDILADLPPGLVGNTTGLTQCTGAQLAGVNGFPTCPPSSQVGTVRLRFNGTPQLGDQRKALFNMVPPTGTPARFGFSVYGSRVNLDASVRSDGDYGLTVGSRNSIQAFALIGTETAFWGNPTSPVHDAERRCPGQNYTGCTVEETAPLLRNPTSCPLHPESEGIPWGLRVSSWDHPDHFESASIVSHEPPNFPLAPEDWGAPQGTTDCDVVPVDASLEAQPTSPDTETSSGLDVHVEVPNPGLENPNGISSSDIKAVEVSLPQGMTVNPSQAEGLGVCKPGQYASTELSFFPTPGKGCPDDSKIGTVEVVTPLLEEKIPGDVFIAQQDDPGTTTHGAENPFDSLLAIYIVLHEPQRGILVKIPGEVTTDEATGRIVTRFDGLPQLPFSSFDFHFRQGARAPLVTPPTCGTYTTTTEITGWSDPAHPIVRTSDFQIAHGIGGGPCPSGGVPPFHPGFEAGAVNDSAGAFTPFLMDLTRQDGEQNMTKFSSVLPPGVSAKIAGVAKCPEAAIAAASAKGRTGRQELASPSCPVNSQIGHTLAGAGVGSVLTYVPGKLYLAGPFNGAPLSVVAITPAVAGPFDVGAVVVREALTLDPKTAEVHVDGDKSEPIPHILKGIPLKLRDLRVYVDRPDFTINPTSCDPSAVGATLFGSYADVFSPADDVPVALSSRFQAANCASLAFKPRLGIKLKGGAKRGGHPALTAVLRPRPGDANLSEAQVTLPRSAFLDQAHIRTVCTRVQFAESGGNGAGCPKGSVYGHVRAWTPLLDEPLSGPAYLRSSNHKLPDLVFALHGVVDIEAAGRIDAVRGGIRATFEAIPDAPISKAVIEMQGGKKGLIVNSRNLCATRNRAKAKLTGQNGKRHDFAPLVKPRCGHKTR